VSGGRLYCREHGGYVRAEDAVIMGSAENGSGAPVPAYACMTCVRDKGLVPPVAAGFVGHRDTPPRLAGGAA
jgi:hypothetical protein